VRFPFGWEAFWGVNDCPVVPGWTYMLQIWRDSGMNIWHVTKNVYPSGQYYEGAKAYPEFDLNGHICCMYYSFRQSADLNGDGKVDLADFSKLAQYWRQNESSVDIAPPPLGDNIVDFKDLAVVAENWLTFPGIVAYWMLDETEGTIAHDSISDKNGNLNGGPIWQPAGGKIDGALQFDGTDDYVSTGFVLNPATGAFSAFACIKGGSTGQVVISQKNRVIWLGADSSYGKLITSLNDSNPFRPALVSDFVITDGDWHRVGVVWDGARRHLYADDAEVARDSSDMGKLVSSDEGVYIGAGPSATTWFWCGLIDDVRIYDRAITP
jgi:hypothetical protein